MENEEGEHKEKLLGSWGAKIFFFGLILAALVYLWL